MTHLNRNRTLVQAASLLFAIGCSSRVEVGQTGTGGSTMGTGGATFFIGGAPGIGGTHEIGGTTPIGMQTGGASWMQTGGATWMQTGGSYPMPETGGATWMQTGGATWMQTGGATWMQTGGSYPMPETGGAGWMQTGGSYPMSETGGAGQVPITNVCTPGADQSCNDDLTVSSLMGHCENNGSCTCATGYVVNRNSGKCTTYDQTVCYSPTQNIDLAYVDRAFGCHCDPNTAAPFCGIDSQGLRVYLECQSQDGAWHSASTSLYCNGSTPVPCYSPTHNVQLALDPNALGCSCSPSAPQQCVHVTQPIDAGPGDDRDSGSPTAALVMKCTTDGRWSAVAMRGCE